MLWVGGNVILGLKGLFIMRFLFREHKKKVCDESVDNPKKMYIF